jgi:hypothetical protein
MIVKKILAWHRVQSICARGLAMREPDNCFFCMSRFIYFFGQKDM